MSTSVIIFIVAATIVNLVVFYYLIQSATRSKAIAEMQEHQLKVLIELALATGVNEEKIQLPVSHYGYRMVKKANKEYMAGKLTHAGLQEIKHKYSY